MKKLILLFVFFLVTTFSFAQSHVKVKGYYRSNGTYVQSHYRTAPDYTINNNWSTVGNVNPYTGKAGTVPRSSSYSNVYYSAPSSTYIPTSTSYSSYMLPTPTYTSITPKYSTPVYSSPVYSTPLYTPSRVYTSPIIIY